MLAVPPARDGGGGLARAASAGAGAASDPETSALTVLDAQRSHRAPEGFFHLPQIASGVETFEVTIPDGLRLAAVDLALTEASNIAGAEIENRPARGSTGRLSLRVRWSHPAPGGAVAFRLRVLATPDGRAPPVVMQMTEPGGDARFRSLVEQDVPVDLALSGPLAQVFHDQILERGGEIRPFGRSADAGVVSGPTAALIISLAVVAAICVMVGMAAFAAVIFYAISRGYNIDNAGYTVATGQGDSRQEHQMVFNIRQPGT